MPINWYCPDSIREAAIAGDSLRDIVADFAASCEKPDLLYRDGIRAAYDEVAALMKKTAEEAARYWGELADAEHCFFQMLDILHDGFKQNGLCREEQIALGMVANSVVVMVCEATEEVIEANRQGTAKDDEHRQVGVPVSWSA